MLKSYEDLCKVRLFVCPICKRKVESKNMKDVEVEGSAGKIVKVSVCKHHEMEVAV